jgi:hypothetical protein
MQKKRRRRTKRSSYFLSSEDKTRLVQMYWDGLHPSEMAEELRISEKTAYKYCTDQFSPINGGWARGFPSMSEGNAIMAMGLKGVKDADIAAQFRRPMWVVARTLRPRPAGIATIEGAPVDVKPGAIMFSPPPKPTLLESIGRFFRRLFGGSH